MVLHKALSKFSFASALIRDRVYINHFQIVSTLIFCNEVFIIMGAVACHVKIFDLAIL